MGRNTGRVVFRIMGAVSSCILGFFGVLSWGCDGLTSAQPTYGPPGTTLTLVGTVYSAADSTEVPGISIGYFSNDSFPLAGEHLTDDNGEYAIDVEYYEFLFDDSVGIYARDIDGIENGLFAYTDTITGIPQTEEPVVEVDFFLEPESGL